MAYPECGEAVSEYVSDIIGSEQFLVKCVDCDLQYGTTDAEFKVDNGVETTG